MRPDARGIGGPFNGAIEVYSKPWEDFQCGPSCEPWRPIELAVKEVGPDVPLLFGSKDHTLTVRAVVSTGPPARTDLAETLDVIARLMLTKVAFSLSVPVSECAGIVASAYRLMEELGKVFRLQLRPGLGNKGGDVPSEIDVSFREMRPSEQGFLKDVSVDVLGDKTAWGPVRGGSNRPANGNGWGRR